MSVASKSGLGHWARRWLLRRVQRSLEIGELSICSMVQAIPTFGNVPEVVQDVGE